MSTITVPQPPTSRATQKPILSWIEIKLRDKFVTAIMGNVIDVNALYDTDSHVNLAKAAYKLAEVMLDVRMGRR
jgi:hypothetical protein